MSPLRCNPNDLRPQRYAVVGGRFQIWRWISRLRDPRMENSRMGESLLEESRLEESRLEIRGSEFIDGRSLVRGISHPGNLRSGDFISPLGFGRKGRAEQTFF